MPIRNKSAFKTEYQSKKTKQKHTVPRPMTINFGIEPV